VVRSFLRIDGDDFALRGGRIVWQPATAGDDEEGMTLQLTAHGSKNLLHLATWVPGSTPADLSGAEVTVTEGGPDGAVDGRLFGVVLVRFGRVDERRAIVSVDGYIGGLEADSDARAQVAADIDCAVYAAEIPAFCNRCGASLADEAVHYTRFVGGRLVTEARPKPTCRACSQREPALAPPRRCSTCGAEYADGGVDWVSDELSMAYHCTCPHGHTVAGTQTIAA
jgi:hypothetical protein